MWRWQTGVTDTHSNMGNTLKVFAHTYDLWRMIPPPRNTLHHSVIPSYISFFSLFNCSQREPKTCCRTIWMQKHKTMKNYMKSLYSQCAVIPFLQESYRLKYSSKMACSEANRWSFETQRGHGTIISTTLPTSHTISMHTYWSTKGGGEKILQYKKLHQMNFFFVCFLSKYQAPEDRTSYRQERKNTAPD